MRNRNFYIIIVLLLVMVGLNVNSITSMGFVNWLVQEILLLPGIVIGLSFHEFGHALVSDRLGDPTPRQQGRLTINPGAHIDWIGFLCLLIAGFGWGIPVQIDTRYYMRPRRDELLVSIAGVAMNLLVAVVFAFLIRILISAGFFDLRILSSNGTASFLFRIFYYVIMINVVLMIFNLIPVPPLDGFGIITQIFDLRKYDWYYTFYNNGMFILLLLIMFNVTRLILDPATQGICGAIMKNIAGIAV